jgi:hypothetical protein
MTTMTGAAEHLRGGNEPATTITTGGHPTNANERTNADGLVGPRLGRGHVAASPIAEDAQTVGVASSTKAHRCLSPTTRKEANDGCEPDALTHWRRLPADQFTASEIEDLQFALANAALLREPRWDAAAQGDAAAANGIALGMLPIERIVVRHDLAMTALVLCALKGSAGAAVALAHVLRKIPAGHPRAGRLGASWLARNLASAGSMGDVGPGLRNRARGTLCHTATESTATSSSPSSATPNATPMASVLLPEGPVR